MASIATVLPGWPRRPTSVKPRAVWNAMDPGFGGSTLTSSQPAGRENRPRRCRRRAIPAAAPEPVGDDPVEVVEGRPVQRAEPPVVGRVVRRAGADGDDEAGELSVDLDDVCAVRPAGDLLKAGGVEGASRSTLRSLSASTSATSVAAMGRSRGRELTAPVSQRWLDGSPSVPAGASIPEGPRDGLGRLRGRHRRRRRGGDEVTATRGRRPGDARSPGVARVAPRSTGRTPPAGVAPACPDSGRRRGQTGRGWRWAQAPRRGGEWVNEVHLVGRVSSEPEERELPSGDVVVLFRLVVPRPAPDRKRPGAAKPASATGRDGDRTEGHPATQTGPVKSTPSTLPAGPGVPGRQPSGCARGTTPRSAVPCGDGSSARAVWQPAGTRWTRRPCAGGTARLRSRGVIGGSAGDLLLLQGPPLVGVEPSPDSVGLAHCQGVLEAGVDDGAPGAVGLGRGLPLPPAGAARPAARRTSPGLPRCRHPGTAIRSCRARASGDASCWP